MTEEKSGWECFLDWEDTGDFSTTFSFIIPTLCLMQYCGGVGQSMAFNVGVDGNGGFDMDVEVISDNGEKTNIRDVLNLDSEMYEQAKRDHMKWSPECKYGIAFGFE